MNSVWVYLEEVTVAPLDVCHWDRSGCSCLSSCVIVFSASVCASQRVSICEWKILYQFGSHSHHSGSVSPPFAGVSDIYIQNYCLSQRDGQRMRERYCLIQLVMFACFETFDAIKLLILCSECPVNGILFFFNRIHHPSPFLPTLTEPLYDT